MRVLLIVHGFPPQGRGGAELYAESVATHLATGFGDEVSVLAREQIDGAPEFRVRQERRDGLSLFWINNTFRTTRRFEDTYVNVDITARASEVIDVVNPDVAHIHHLTCLSTTIVDELARRRIPVVLTLHDYWLICHRGQLLDTTLARCDGPGQDGCPRCTGLASGPPVAHAGARVMRMLPSAVSARLRPLSRPVAAAFASETEARAASLRRLIHMRERVAQASAVLAPSTHVRDRFVRAGFVDAPIVVSEYGVMTPARLAPPADTGRPLRLGFAGALMVSKAPHLLADAAALLPAGAVQIEIYGAPAPYHGDDTYPRTIERRLTHPAITLHGPIPHADVPRVFASLDALVFPSVWEETSGIGAREALAAGVPVIASRIGGIPQTVHHGVNGLLFEPGDAAALAAQIRRLLDEPRLLARLRASCHAPRGIDVDVASLRERYQELVRRSPVGRASGRLSSSVAAVILNYRTPDQTALTARMLLRSNAVPTPVLVIDNGDGLECGAALAALGQGVAMRATGGNLGFSAGCNVGIREALSAGAEAVLLVNSDVVVPPDCVGLLVEALGRQARPGIVAPVVRSRAWPDQVLSAGIDYDVDSGRMRLRQQTPEHGAVHAVSGCAMLIHRDVFDRIGLLPEPYFFSFEDIAFCQQARAAGFDVAVAARAAVYHEGGGTIGLRPRRLYYAARNHLRLGTETPARSAWHRLRRQFAIAGFNLAHAVTAEGGALPTRLAEVTRGIADHLRGRYGEG